MILAVIWKRSEATHFLEEKSMSERKRKNVGKERKEEERKKNKKEKSMRERGREKEKNGKGRKKETLKNVSVNGKEKKRKGMKISEEIWTRLRKNMLHPNQDVSSQ